MFIDPRTAIREGWITFPEWMQDEYRHKCIQPNALDFTIDGLYGLDDFTPFIVNEQKRVMRETYKISATLQDLATENQHEEFNNGFFWHLNRGSCYDAMSDFHVKVPEGIAAILVPRSTFNRNGTFIMSGLYDSGFDNNIGFMIYNMGGHTLIQPGTRIGQIIFTKSENSGILYDGIYNQNQGQHWSTNTSKEHPSFKSGDNVGEFAVDPTKSPFA